MRQLFKALFRRAAAEKYGADTVLSDGVHPATLGAKIIADEWMKLFNEKLDK